MPAFVPFPVVTPQGVNCPAFVPPPVDGSISLPEAYDWHLARSPEHDFYTYQDVDGTVRTIKWKEATHAVYRAAHIALAHAADKPTFAILAVADSITFGTMAVGIMRAGFTPFVPSPRVSAEVLAQLLDKAGTTHVFYSPDAATTKLAHAGTAHRSIKLLPLPSFGDLFTTDPVAAPNPVAPDMFDHGMIIHSSGSTSIPKLLPLSHITLVVFGAAPWTHEIDMGSSVMNFAVTPVYHLMGFSQVIFAAFCGVRAAVFAPVSPPIMPRVETFLQSVQATKSKLTLIMPSMLETISNNPEQMKILADMDAVIFGGASLKQAAGDQLVEAGVPLMTGFGMSECGVISAFMHKPLGRDWQWMRLARFVKAHFRDLGDGTHELIVLSHDGQYIDTTNTEVEGHRACATKDVVVVHPTEPRTFKIVGRLDDQLVLSTGEKTNAIPLEGILRSDPLVEYAVVFGRGRPHNGVIIMPPAEHAFDPSDAQRLREYRDAIWPTVVKMNNFAPSHSRISKEMILVAHPSKPFAINQTKNTVVRALITAAYEQEINECYEAFERATEQEFPVPDSWELADVQQFVRDLVQSSIPDITKDEDDLFNYGCDSLIAARIHNSIVGALQTSGVDTKKIPGDLPYKFPTIQSLAKFTATFASSSAEHGASAVADVEAMLQKYTASFPQHSGAASISNGVHHGHAVLVTGTTGGLGTNLLAQLLQSNDVRRVYALNRRSSGHHLVERQKANFLDRGLDPGLLDLEKLVLLEGDTTQADLGLHHLVYEELLSNVTHIIHNAWPVNFNYALPTFEPAVKGARHLVDLALKSTLPAPPKFEFISSVSVSRNASPSPGLAPLEEPILDAKLVVGMGYAESKWVVERMLQIAAEQTPLKTLSIRVGQLAGSQSGAWNVNDWVPVIVRSASKLACLPDSTSNIFWMRLEEAAGSVIDMLAFPESGILHLVHPRPISWRAVFQQYSSQLHVPLVPFEQWLARVAKNKDPEGVPAVRLLEFWKSFGDRGFDGMGSMEDIDTRKAQEISPTLKNMRPLDEKDAKGWFEYWQRAGVLPK